jgi:two-component system sensor histidine kinase FlrB
MLPDSHIAPRNVALADYEDEGNARVRVDQLHMDGNCHRQKDSKNELEEQARSAELLSCEFSDFILAASKLENSYRELQKEVSELSLELSERNAALNSSLAENERMRLALQQIVDSMPCGVLVLDRRGKTSMINPESRRLLGLDGAHFGERSQKTLRQISSISGLNLEAACECASSSDAGQEFCIQDSSGKRWLEVRNRRLFQRSGGGKRPDQTILILRDTTAQKRAEEEREAGRKAMALAEISTVLAHEIRNPLASLELFAELIQTDGERRGKWISNLRAGIRSLSGTVNNVLSFHGSGSLKLIPVPLSAIIGHAIQFVQPLADQAAVSLAWMPDQGQVWVMGNESALQQVVLNLVANAIRHTPADGTVSVSFLSVQTAAKQENHGMIGDHVTVEFSDTGCGIRPDQIGRVFEPGFSGRGDTSGLGLAVCERIMKQHGGRISASNIMPTGARFTLDFPVLQQGLVTA